MLADKAEDDVVKDRRKAVGAMLLPNGCFVVANAKIDRRFRPHM
jgi:hypothetical protein